LRKRVSEAFVADSEAEVGEVVVELEKPRKRRRVVRSPSRH